MRLHLNANRQHKVHLEVYNDVNSWEGKNNRPTFTLTLKKILSASTTKIKTPFLGKEIQLLMSIV